MSSHSGLLATTGDVALHGIWRYAAVGLAVGVVLTLADPFVAAVIAMGVAAIGVGLSEGRARPARTVLMVALGLGVPALCGVLAAIAAVV